MKPFVTVNQAAELLMSADVVAIPTETVYGLAAKIDIPSAIEKIFTTKERPFFDPLIVHVGSVIQAQSLVSAWPQAATVLAEKFWPGPMTLVLPKAAALNPMITSGLDTVGIRWPRHPLAVEIIERTGPLAAPSANKFGRTSPTQALHVAHEFQNVAVVDGGACEVGIESTIIKIDAISDSEAKITLLRPGQIKLTEIESVLRAQGITCQFVRAGSEIVAPGQVKHHYMPSIPLILAKASQRSDWQKQIAQQFKKEFEYPEELNLASDSRIAARELYARMRELAIKDVDALVFFKEDYHQGEEWQAFFDRLKRAATFILE